MDSFYKYVKNLFKVGDSIVQSTFFQAKVVESYPPFFGYLFTCLRWHPVNSPQATQMDLL
ncbi:MAG: hypothetical protein CMI25_04465 [Opitutae bacterium]|nr:hypothetical protein [Opitutae bacterium]